MLGVGLRGMIWVSLVGHWEDRVLQTAFRKLLGAYLMGMAVFVAVWFLVNPFFDADGVRDLANYLMAAALVFNARWRLRYRVGEHGVCDGLRQRVVNLWVVNPFEYQEAATSVSCGSRACWARASAPTKLKPA